MSNGSGANSTWRDRRIPSRCPEKVGRTIHPHVKPIGRLIGAVTTPGELVVDPAAGGFVVLRAANQLGREFVGCDIAYHSRNQERSSHARGAPGRQGGSVDAKNAYRIDRTFWTFRTLS